MNYIKVETAKLPPEWPYVRVAQISDIHLGLIVREDRLKKIVEAIEASSPHRVVSTGDLVDGQMDGRQKEIDLLQSLSAPLGKFAVTGNHEVYAGLNQATSFIEECGFQVIRNEVLNLAPLLLAGVDDDDIKMAESFSPSEQNLLSSLSPHRFRLFLKHRPIVMEDSIDFFDLQLSGHVHGGQMWPFTLVTRAVYPMGTGLHRLKNEVMLYVTSGAGTWGPPMRFLATPEVVIIDIVNSETAKK
ncbi:MULTISPECIES: metallophosphoesterase [Aminobacterium]|uniref:metallophosphoesterase n=1 Tax=Aminobacterium TaxID=81466 RepID=UPI00257E6B1D|nr:metallophosphoesterase [Aminobacterium sp. UBA4987]